jgi:hypothetical protein
VTTPTTAQPLNVKILVKKLNLQTVFRINLLSILFLISIVWSSCTNTTNNKHVKKKQASLTDIIHFADSLQLDTNILLKDHFNSKNSLYIGSCDFKQYRNVCEFKKAISIVIWKIGKYCDLKKMERC